jgi:hypothetical protein
VPNLKNIRVCSKTKSIGAVYKTKKRIDMVGLIFGFYSVTQKIAFT